MPLAVVYTGELPCGNFATFSKMVAGKIACQSQCEWSLLQHFVSVIPFKPHSTTWEGECCFLESCDPLRLHRECAEPQVVVCSK